MTEHIADTGPLVGWINARDQWHDWSVEVLEALEPPLLTCEAVVAEAAWHLGPSRSAVDQLYAMIDEGALRIVPILPEHTAHIRALAAKYPEMDYCDAAVVRLAEIFPRAKVISTDSGHFSRYRRFRDKPLDLILPERP